MFKDDDLEFEDDEFQWNIKKARDNLRDHGVSFERARKAFDDRNGIMIPDTRQDYGEDCFNLIGGIIDGGEPYIVVVTHTFRGSKTRIILAREA